MIVQDDVRFVTLRNQTKIAYMDCGGEQRETILFVHGLANYLWVWKWNIAELQTKYRCIAIDLPGNGYSSRGDYPYSIRYYADILLEFIEALQLNKVTICGHSMGGQIALECALSNKDAVERLILSAPAGFEYYTPSEATLFKSAIAFGNFLSMDETHIIQSINSSFYRHQQIADEIINDLNSIIKVNDRIAYRRMLELCIDSMLTHQVFHRLKKIKQKTLVLFGENDQLIPNRFLHPVSTLEIAKRGCKQMPNATLRTYKETGHFVHIEQAVAVNHEISLFIDG